MAMRDDGTLERAPASAQESNGLRTKSVKILTKRSNAIQQKGQKEASLCKGLEPEHLPRAQDSGIINERLCVYYGL